MTDDVAKVGNISGDKSAKEAQKAAKTERMLFSQARQVASQDRFEQWSETGTLFNPRQLQKKFEPLKDKLRESPRKNNTEKSETQKESANSRSTAASQIAETYQKRNPELQKNTLLALRSYIKPEDSSEEILEKIQQTYTDESLADEAIDFLIEVSENKKIVQKKLIETKERFNTTYGREIRAGRNIAANAREFSQAGLGSATGLRDLYREITGKPKDPHQLFDELSKKFKFSDMKNIIDFILHSLGADMKSKGPSISREELQRLFGEARNMQAILGVFRFFFSRMKLIKGQFSRFGLSMPGRVNFEALAKLLMELLQERYPSSNKILQLAYTLGVSEELAAQIIILTQYRDAMRHISPKLFKSERHRQELLLVLIETLSDLEDDFDEEDNEN